MPRPILLLATRAHSTIPTLITNAIVPLPITRDLRGITHLIFTSRSAVDSIQESSSPHSPFYNPALLHWRQIPSLALSAKTASALTQLHARVEFIGRSGYGEGFAQEILPLLRASESRTESKRAESGDSVPKEILRPHARPLYLRAQEIASPLPALLRAAHIPLQEAIAYTNKPLTLNPALKPKPHSVLIFTAPSVYRSFCQNFGWEEGYRAIAIGRSTLAAFDKGIDSYLSDEPSIESCLTLARKLAH